mgnify:CR=1 FL=1
MLENELNSFKTSFSSPLSIFKRYIIDMKFEIIRHISNLDLKCLVTFCRCQMINAKMCCTGFYAKTAVYLVEQIFYIATGTFFVLTFHSLVAWILKNEKNTLLMFPII